MQFTEPDWTSMEPRNHLVFDTLVSFLDSAASDPANVQHLTNSAVAMLGSIGTQNPSIDQYRFESRELFGVLFTVVTQLDAAAVQQDYLIKLVLSLREMPLPATVAETIDPRDRDNSMNKDLSKLINVLSGFEWDAPLHPRLENRPGYKVTPMPKSQDSPWRQETGQYLTPRAWASINAFIARLHAAAPDLYKLDVRGLFAMIEALEQPLTANQLDDVLPAAACWVIYAGQELQRNDMPYAYYGDDEGTKSAPWSKGELWKGQHAFNEARWDFWMQRFKGIAERDDIGDTVRLAAWNALEAGP